MSFIKAKIITKPSIEKPAVRMVAVRVAVILPDKEYPETRYTIEIVPVVAIQVALVYHIYRPDDGSVSAVPQTLDDLKQDNRWKVEWRGVEHDRMINYDDTGDGIKKLVSVERRNDVANQLWKVVISPWPADEDEECLKHEIETLKSKVLWKVRAEKVS